MIQTIDSGEDCLSKFSRIFTASCQAPPPFSGGNFHLKPLRLDVTFSLTWQNQGLMWLVFTCSVSMAHTCQARSLSFLRDFIYNFCVKMSTRVFVLIPMLAS